MLCINISHDAFNFTQVQMSTSPSKKRKTAASSPSSSTNGKGAAATSIVVGVAAIETETSPHFGELRYMPGFGGEKSSEAVAGALPANQNTPQRCAFGLYAEQLSGTAFTKPRASNQRTWLYRIRPSANVTSPLKKVAKLKTSGTIVADFSDSIVHPTQTRWAPFALPPSSSSIDWVDGLSTVGGSGSAELKTGFAVHVWRCK
jgi:homogentisate 1,2-dioxygenase